MKKFIGFAVCAVIVAASALILHRQGRKFVLTADEKQFLHDDVADCPESLGLIAMAQCEAAKQKQAQAAAAQQMNQGATASGAPAAGSGGGQDQGAINSALKKFHPSCSANSAEQSYQKGQPLLVLLNADRQNVAPGIVKFGRIYNGKVAEMTERGDPYRQDYAASDCHNAAYGDDDNWSHPCASWSAGWYMHKGSKIHVPYPDVKGLDEASIKGAKYFNGCGYDPLTNVHAGDTISLTDMRLDRSNPGASFSLSNAKVIDIFRDGGGLGALSMVLLAQGDIITLDNVGEPYSYDNGGSIQVANKIDDETASKPSTEDPIWRYGVTINIPQEDNKNVSFSVMLPGKYANCVLANGMCQKDPDGNLTGLAEGYTVTDSQALRACKKIGGSLPTADEILGLLRRKMVSVDGKPVRDDAGVWTDSFTPSNGKSYASFGVYNSGNNGDLLGPLTRGQTPEHAMGVICVKRPN
jgi:hypothetical protein